MTIIQIDFLETECSTPRNSKKKKNSIKITNCKWVVRVSRIFLFLEGALQQPSTRVCNGYDFHPRR